MAISIPPSTPVMVFFIRVSTLSFLDVMKNVNVTSEVLRAGTEATAIEICRSLRRSADLTGGSIPSRLIPLISVMSILVKVILCLAFTLVLKHFIPDLPENTELTP